MSLEIRELFDRLPQIGTVEWIGLRPGREEPIEIVSSVEVSQDEGLVGDRFAGARSSTRQVTLIQSEHLPAIASMLAVAQVLPEQLRRNILVRGVNLLALKNRKFSVGGVVLEGTGLCQPCSKMEKILGPGGYNAVRGHGGITARVISGGKVHIGDRVELCRSEAVGVD